MKRGYLWLLLAVFAVVAAITGYLGYLLWTKTNETVSVGSSYPSISLSKTNKFSELNSYLNVIGFWKQNAVVSTDGKQPKTAKKLIINLVNTRQGGLIIDSSADPNIALASFGYAENESKISVLLYFNKDECIKTNCDADTVLNKELILALYLITHSNSQDYIAVLNSAKSLAQNYQEIYVKVHYKENLRWWQKILPKLSKIFNLNVYAADCATWFCGEQHASGACGPAGFTESASSCSYDCPPGYCVQSGSETCNCAGTPNCPNYSSCGVATCDTCTQQCCWDGCRPLDVSCSYCGDGACHNEDCITCPQDCGQCPPTPTPTPTSAPSTCHFEGCSTSHSTYYYSYDVLCSGACTLGCDDQWPTWYGNDVGCVNTNGDQYIRTTGCEAVCTTTPTPTPTPTPPCVVPGGNCVSDQQCCSGNCNISGKCVGGGTPTPTPTSGGHGTPTPTPTPQPSGPWWQVIDGDVQTNGDLNVSVPTGLYFNLPGLGGFPGVAKYGASTNLSSAKVSVKGWLANSLYAPANNKVQNYAYFKRMVPNDTVLNPVTSTDVPGSFFSSGGTASYGYFWYEYDASLTGLPLSITSPINLPDGRKVIILVTGADLNIQGKITYTSGQSVLVTLVDGNINIDPSVGGAAFDLQGFYLANGNISTGVSSTSLHVKGSMIALGELNLQRNLGSVLNPTQASEVFEYDPATAFLFPPKLSVEKTRWKEVAP